MSLEDFMYPVFVRKGAMMKRSQRKQGRSKVTILSILPKRLFNGQWSTKKENMLLKGAVADKKNFWLKLYLNFSWLYIGQTLIYFAGGISKICPKAFFHVSNLLKFERRRVKRRSIKIGPKWKDFLKIYSFQKSINLVLIGQSLFHGR